MKKLIVVALVVSLFSCKKDEQTLCKSPTNPVPHVEIASKPGSYFVYHWYEIDSLGNETTLSMIDTINVVGDSIINGNTFVCRFGSYMGFTPRYEFLRDSAGYIINQQGQVFYSYSSLGDTIYEYLSGPYRCTEIMELNQDLNHEVPAGVFSSFILNKVWGFANGAPLGGCVGNEFTLKSYYSSGIGLIREQTGYMYPIINECRIMERRLVDYYIP